MLDLIFYTRKNQTMSLKVSESTYENLAFAGLSTIVDYSQTLVIIEDEQYDLNVSKLNFDNRMKLLSLVEKERQVELEKIFKTLDDSPTIKEIREKFIYVKTLTELYKQFKNEENIYFSYE